MFYHSLKIDFKHKAISILKKKIKCVSDLNQSCFKTLSSQKLEEHMMTNFRLRNNISRKKLLRKKSFEKKVGLGMDDEVL